MIEAIVAGMAGGVVVMLGLFALARYEDYKLARKTGKKK